MKIVGARWTPKVNKYVIACKCGKRFEHATNRWKVVCRGCGARGLVKVLRQRIRKGDVE